MAFLAFLAFLAFARRLLALAGFVVSPKTLPPPPYDPKNIFRIANIPHNVSLEAFPTVLSSLCALRPDEIQVCSFSRVDSASTASTITATATFSQKPGFWDASVCPETKRMRQAITLRMSDGDDTHLLKVDQQLLGFTPLTPLAIQSTPGRKSIDCIVLHGFGAHALGSFQGRESPDIWIRDWLPNDFEQLDVLTYGYGTHFSDPNSTGDVREWAHLFHMDLSVYRSETKGNKNFKPLIFIVHSLGGLVFKQAITDIAKSSHSQDHNMVKCIHDVFFFGVPSQGMDTKDMEVMAKRHPSRITVALLNRDFLHRMRQELNTEFDKAFPFKDSKIYQFYEALPTEGFEASGQKRLLLPQTSTIGRHWENDNDYKFSIQGDHRTLVKFSRTDRSQYGIVRRVMDGTMERNPWNTIQDRFLWGHREVPPGEQSTYPV